MKVQSYEINPKRTPVVMIVDDEEMVTKTLSTYLQLETDYEILTFQSPTFALKRLRRAPVDLVISDFLMPEMDGLQFIAEAQKLYPDQACVLLTGYADKQNAIKAINEVRLFQYVEKPWDNEHLKLMIRNAIQSRTLQEILEEKVQELDGVLLERDKLVQDNEMIKEELLLAKKVQQSLLPQSFPNSSAISLVAKYSPALEIGGDFYDVVPIANDKLAVLIADVTGHGIQAALITVLLKSAFLDFKDSETRPGEILAFMNNLLYKILPESIYVAGMVVIIDCKTAQCRLANGGIPHPYLIKSREDDVERIAANGLLLGITDKDLFKPGKEVSFQLHKGDSLILYTDGLSEAGNAKEQHFEDEMMQTLLEARGKMAKEILDHLTQAAKKFSADEHRWDDVTILGIEYN